MQSWASFWIWCGSRQRSKEGSFVLFLFFCLLGLMKYPIRAIQEATAEPAAPERVEQSPQDWKIKMLYDGECPLCMREVGSRHRTIAHFSCSIQYDSCVIV